MMKIQNQILLLLFMIICIQCDKDESVSPKFNRNFKDDMRKFVIGISEYAKNKNPNFIVIPQNGLEILTENGETDGLPAMQYIHAIDGVGREDLFYGYDDDNKATPEDERNYMILFLTIAEQNNVQALVTDYCWTKQLVDDSYQQNEKLGYISFAADHRELDNIPQYPSVPYNANAEDIKSLKDAKNFLYLLNPESFNSNKEFLDTLIHTDFDIILIDLFFNGTEELNTEEITSLKLKLNGGSRLVIAYMSIGEAEDYRYYWKSQYKKDKPEWIDKENPDWKGNYKVRYWMSDWQNIIYGNDSSYLQKILNAGFDGVYLDIIDAFEYFEDIN